MTLCTSRLKAAVMFLLLVQRAMLVHLCQEWFLQCWGWWWPSKAWTEESLLASAAHLCVQGKSTPQNLLLLPAQPACRKYRFAQHP